MSAVRHLQFIVCTDDAIKKNEEPQDMPTKYHEEAYLGLSIDQNKPLKMTNSTLTDVILSGAWYNIMVQST